MIWLTAIWKFMKSVPWWVYAVVGLLFSAYLYGESRYRSGEARVQGLWDASTAHYADALRKEKDRQSKVEVQTVTEYVDRVKTVYVKGDTIIKRIPQYVPADTPALPGGWRLLHDAAATGSDLPESPGGIQADPVGAQDAAETVTGNYTACYAELEKLNGLWKWAEGVSGSVEVSRNGL